MNLMMNSICPSSSMEEPLFCNQQTGVRFPRGAFMIFLPLQILGVMLWTYHIYMVVHTTPKTCPWYWIIDYNKKLTQTLEHFEVLHMILMVSGLWGVSEWTCKLIIYLGAFVI